MKFVLIVGAIVVAVAFVVVLLRRANRTARTEPEPSGAPGEFATIDPSKLLSSLPTICDRMAPLQAPTEAPTRSDLTMHEDEWRQIEFVPLVDSAYIASKLAELRQFKIERRSGPGWTDTFARPDHPTDSGTLSLRFTDLSTAFSVKAGRI